MIFLLFLLLSDTAEQFKLEKINQFFQTIKGDNYFTSPYRFLSTEDELFMVDNVSLEVLNYNLKTKEMHFFSSQGHGPGELRVGVNGFYSRNGFIHIINAYGAKVDIFEHNGKLSFSGKKPTLPSGLFFYNDDVYFYKDGSHFVLKSQTGKEIREKVFDFQTYGFQVDVTVLGNYLFVTTPVSKNHSIKYMLFDSKSIALLDIGIIEKWNKSEEKDLPKLPPGVSYEHYYEQNYPTVTMNQQMGFLIKEMSYTKPISPQNGYSSVVHVYDPETKNIKTIKFFHQDIKEIIFFYPLGGKNWLMFESSEDNLIYAEFSKIKGRE